MTTKEVTQLFSMITMAYPRDSAFSTCSPMMVEMWARALQDIPFDLAQKALFAHIRTGIFPPTIAEIVAMSNDIAEGNTKRLTAEEAWATVEKAISNSAYRSVEEFHRLSPKCQKLVGSSNQLYEWSQCETGSSAISFARERFIRQYDILLSNEKQARKLPQELRAMLGQEETPQLPRPDTKRQLPSREEEQKEPEIDPEAQARAQRIFDLVAQMTGGKSGQRK